MKIQNSSISMSSYNNYSSYSYVESVSIEGRASEDLEGVILSLSKEAENGSYKEAIESYEKQQEEAERKKYHVSLMQPLKTNSSYSGNVGTSDEYDLKLQLLKQMLAMLSKGKNLSELPAKNLNENGVLELRSRAAKMQVGETRSISGAVSAGYTAVVNTSDLTAGTTSTGTLWTKLTATSGTFAEYESTTFVSKGIVKTEDGRNIDFNVSFSMSRACEMEINTLEASNYILTDPLVINMDTDMTSISDQKFFFDLDSDGKEDEMSFVGKGSGFLALDKNGDGIINDGSELFGTASGDGFKDLAAYNEDGNLWIDENDSVFSKLKVWTKDEDGNDVLLSLKEADVGAIYLGNANTDFTYKNEANQTNAVLRKTGVFLKESTGQAGTVSHVDLAI